MRIRTLCKEYPKMAIHRFFYYSLILGILPRLNFNSGISFGIGVGIYIPLCSAVKREGKDAWGEEITTGLEKYVGINRFNFEKIYYMYKVPIMPYIKLNLEKIFICRSFGLLRLEQIYFIILVWNLIWINWEKEALNITLGININFLH